jgi:hypothetical protein
MIAISGLRGDKFKVVNGQYIERTPEELAELARRRAAYYPKPNPPPHAKTAGRMSRSKELFVRVTRSQAQRMRDAQAKGPHYDLFFVMLFENFQSKGQPFALPTEKLESRYPPRTLYRMVLKLCQAGVISIERQHRKQPLVTII